jgi:CRP-like cAMP-binding protein
MIVTARRSFDQSFLFQNLSKEDLRLMRELFHPEQYVQDQIVFAQGAPAEKLHILTSGRAVIRYKPYDSDPLIVAEIPPGAVFGWSAILGRREYSSEAIIVESGEGMSAIGSRIKRFCRSHPDTGQILLDRLATAIANRLDTAKPQITELLMLGLQGSLGV